MGVLDVAKDGLIKLLNILNNLELRELAPNDLAGVDRAFTIAVGLLNNAGLGEEAKQLKKIGKRIRKNHVVTNKDPRDLKSIIAKMEES